MSAPFSPWERMSTTEWVYGPEWEHYTRKARRSIGKDILRRLWTRAWCRSVSDPTRDAALALIERIQKEPSR